MAIRGSPAKGVGRETDARVRISPAPPYAELSEWFKELVLKTNVAERHPEFESLTQRQRFSIGVPPKMLTPTSIPHNLYLSRLVETKRINMLW